MDSCKCPSASHLAHGVTFLRLPSQPARISATTPQPPPLVHHRARNIKQHTHRAPLWQEETLWGICVSVDILARDCYTSNELGFMRVCVKGPVSESF